VLASLTLRNGRRTMRARATPKRVLASCAGLFEWCRNFRRESCGETGDDRADAGPETDLFGAASSPVADFGALAVPLGSLRRIASRISRRQVECTCV